MTLSPPRRDCVLAQVAHCQHLVGPSTFSLSTPTLRDMWRWSIDVTSKLKRIVHCTFSPTSDRTDFGLYVRRKQRPLHHKFPYSEGQTAVGTLDGAPHVCDGVGPAVGSTECRFVVFTHRGRPGAAGRPVWSADVPAPIVSWQRDVSMCKKRCVCVQNFVC